MRQSFNPTVILPENSTPEGLPKVIFKLPMEVVKDMMPGSFIGFARDGRVVLAGRLFYGHLWNGEDEVVKIEVAPDVASGFARHNALHCRICKCVLNSDAASEDCGGDCLRCMADRGDPQAVRAMKKIRSKS